MAKYHPGRRKRHEIMYDLAVGHVFGLPKRLTYQERKALDRLIETQTAFDGTANREVVDVAVSCGLDVVRNTARDVISSLESKGLVVLTRYGNRVKMSFPDWVLEAMCRLECLERTIDRVVLVEDQNVKLDITKDVETLKELGIYIRLSDEELDRAMKTHIEKEVDDYRTTRGAKKVANLNTDIKKKARKKS